MALTFVSTISHTVRIIKPCLCILVAFLLPNQISFWGFKASMGKPTTLNPCQPPISVTVPILDSAIAATIKHSSILPKLKGHWIPSNILVEAIATINVMSPELLSKTAKSFNRLLAKSQLFRDCKRFDGSNQCGLFKVVYSKKTYLYVAEEGEQVAYPVVGKDFVKLTEEFKSSISFMSGRSNSIPTTTPLSPHHCSSSKKIARKHSSTSYSTSQSSDSPRTKKQKLLGQTYWDSPEALALFCPNNLNNGSAADVLEKRIEILKLCQKYDQWKLVIHGHDPDNLCSEYDKVIIRHKSLTLLLAYQIALTKMPNKTWIQCCGNAVRQINSMGITVATSGKTVANYNCLF